MTTPALYDIETSEAANGSRPPTECLWTPSKDATESGFVVHRGLYVTGVDAPADVHPYPVAFLMLGHQSWGDVIEASAAYTERIYGWRSLDRYPGVDPAALIPRIPRAVQTHGVFLQRPHPHHGCNCEWDVTWRMIWTLATQPGAAPVTAMRHPAALVTTAGIGIPDPDNGGTAVWAA